MVVGAVANYSRRVAENVVGTVVVVVVRDVCGRMTSRNDKRRCEVVRAWQKKEAGGKWGAGKVATFQRKLNMLSCCLGVR